MHEERKMNADKRESLNNVRQAAESAAVTAGGR